MAFKPYRAKLTREIVTIIRWQNAFGQVHDTTQLTQEPGEFAFKTRRDRDAWVATTNAEHPEAAVAIWTPSPALMAKARVRA